MAVLAAAWLGVLLAATIIVTYPLGPVFERRQQHHLLTDFRTEVSQAANAQEGLAGRLDRAAPTAPDLGDSVAIVDLGPIGVRQVVTEGVRARDTAKGPGHVPGSAGIGQPGNAVVVGRRAGWGGPFSRIDRLRPGQEIVVTTTDGQSAYRVESVRTTTDVDGVMAPTDDARLTLVTSASRSPFATDDALVVVASLEGRPFQPTPQGQRDGDDGRVGDAGSVLVLVGLVAAFLAVVAATVVAHRRWKPVTAFLLTMPALVAVAVIVAEHGSRLLPAWS